MEKNILIVEDELSLQNILEVYFKKEGFTVIKASDGLKALEQFELYSIDIACVDVMIPHINGFEVVKSIRQKSDIPILMMTALSSEENQLKGYGLDIDDYVTKPFSPTILVAKVKSILKRYNDKQVKSNLQNHQLGLLEINFQSRVVAVENNVIELSKTEFDLLAYFIKNKGIVIDRVTFLDEIWGMDVYVEDRIVDTFIKTLRKKLGPASKYIKTVFGVGYKFEVD
ncbi:response regulator transcription factor [Mycoplasmatota bacterium zrk1]